MVISSAEATLGALVSAAGAAVSSTGASVGAGAHGLMIEVHNDPPHALCDGAQSVRPEEFKDIVERIDVMLPLVNKHRTV